MNNNIPTGLSCNWNGQRWTPTVTNLQDQWAAQTPPGIARGKVWQPKAAPPPPSSVTSVDIDDISDDHLEEVVASGFPLDLSTFRSGGSPSRHVESPLDLSVKTRKRCADSTIRCQQYGQSGKKMCLSSRDILLHQDVVDTVTSRHNYMHAQELHHNDTLSRDYHPNSVSRDSHPSNVSRDSYPSHVSRDSHPSNVSRESHNSRHHIHLIDPMVLKHDYTSSNQHLQNIHKVQHSNKIYAQDNTEVRYANQAISRPYPKPSNQQVSHHHISMQKISQQRTELSKYFPVNIPREREFSGGDPSKYFRQDVLSTNPGISPLVRSADNYHLMPQVQKTLSSTSTPTPSRYLGSHSTNDSYDYLRNSPAVSYNQIVTSSRSPALHQNRPSVLSGGLQFKQPQECCSPDSTFVVNSPAESQSHSSSTSRGSTVNSDVVSRRQLDKCDLSKGNRVSSTSYSSRGSNMNSAGVSRDCSSTSYTPSSSPRCGFFSNSPNMISSRKSPSNKSVSKLTSSGSSISDSTPIMQHVNDSRSIIMGTSGSISKDCTSETVIRNPRPRLWNPNQSKQNLWKFQEETFQGGNHESISNISNKFSEYHASSNVSEKKVVSDVSGKTQFNGPLEIAIPTAKTVESKTESKPKPFSKKHIIMNAFRNDESMKHILEEQKVVKPLQTTESARNTVIAQDKVVRSQDSGVFISPESPKMPTLSPQQKLPAPKVSPLMVEPPTLDLASSQGNRRRQNKVSPSRKTHLKHAFEGGQHNDKHDYSIQSHSSFPQRPKLPYKKIPIANVAPMIHGKCNSTENDSDKLNQDFKQFVSIPTPQPIQAFRVSTSIVNQKETQDFDIKEYQSAAHLIKSDHSKTKCEKILSKKATHKSTTKNTTTENSKQHTSKETNDRNKSASLDLDADTEVSNNEIHKDKDCRNTPKNADSNDKKLKERTIINARRKPKYPQRKVKIISNTKRKADEIRRRAIERKYKGCLSGCTSMKMRRLRKRFQMVKPRGFIDFQPEVLETRTRRKSAGRRVYHRNAAYEDELWREEKRKAVRHRQRVRRFNKRLSLKGKVSNREVTKTIPEVTTESVPVPVTDTTESKEEEDNSGTWEVKNTSTMLRNGKSKGALSMKLLFRPQERRQFRRRMRKRGRIRYGLRKAVPRRSKLVPYHPGLSQSITPLSKELNGQVIDVHSLEYSGYDFDASEHIADASPVPYIPSLPEVKKLSVCKDTGETILHRAARMGYTDAALSYLQTGTVDVNVRDNAGYTPLHESCVSGNMKIARMLLSYGAMVNCASQDGIRPIHDAVDNDFVSLVRLLLSYGADPTISTYGGKTPIKIAHSKKMKSLIQGYLGDINGFNEDSEQSFWEFQILENETIEGDDIFMDIPSDPEIEPEEDVFQESSTPLFNQYTVNESISTDGLCVVLLKDVSDFLHIKTADIIKDKSIKSVLIEDAKDMIQTSSACSFYQERIQNVIETNCRLLPVQDLHLVFSKFEKKKTLEKERKAAAAEKICGHGTLTGEKSAIAIAKSPKHKTLNSRSHHDI